MTGNHRIVQRIADAENSYSVHEVYDEKGEITSRTAEAIAPFGESLQELRDEVAHFLEAFQQPVLREVLDANGVERK